MSGFDDDFESIAVRAHASNDDDEVLLRDADKPGFDKWAEALTTRPECSPQNQCVGSWRAFDGAVMVDSMRGKRIATMGVTEHGRRRLYVEEALHLLDEGHLRLLRPGIVFKEASHGATHGEDWGDYGNHSYASAGSKAAEILTVGLGFMKSPPPPPAAAAAVVSDGRAAAMPSGTSAIATSEAPVAVAGVISSALPSSSDAISEATPIPAAAIAFLAAAASDPISVSLPKLPNEFSSAMAAGESAAHSSPSSAANIDEQEMASSSSSSSSANVASSAHPPGDGEVSMIPSTSAGNDSTSFSTSSSSSASASSSESSSSASAGSESSSTATIDAAGAAAAAAAAVVVATAPKPKPKLNIKWPPPPPMLIWTDFLTFREAFAMLLSQVDVAAFHVYSHLKSLSLVPRRHVPLPRKTSSNSASSSSSGGQTMSSNVFFDILNPEAPWNVGKGTSNTYHSATSSSNSYRDGSSNSSSSSSSSSNVEFNNKSLTAMGGGIFFKEEELVPVFDVYARDGLNAFKITAPGPPDAYIMISKPSDPPPTSNQLRRLQETLTEHMESLKQSQVVRLGAEKAELACIAASEQPNVKMAIASNSTLSFYSLTLASVVKTEANNR